MKIVEYAANIRKAILDNWHDVNLRRKIEGISHSGDSTYGIDAIAEKQAFLAKEKFYPDASIFTEDEGVKKGSDGILIVDPIDGTRPAAAMTEGACVSVAFARGDKMKDIEEVVVYDIKDDRYFWADRENFKLVENGKEREVVLTKNTDLSTIFWTLGFVARPAKVLTALMGDLIDKSSKNGGFFVNNSISYDVTRILLGSYDLALDPANYILKKKPKYLEEFKKAGNGKVLGLFPYDIAGIYLISKVTGLILTDCEGNDLDEIKLTDVSFENQVSILAASNKKLHEEVINYLETNINKL